MDDQEKILRWDLQESIKELNSDIKYELPFTWMVSVIMEERRKNVDLCSKKLNEYLKRKKLNNDFY